MEIIIHNNHLALLSQKAVFWREEKTLLISDLHLGKITHFRKEGIPLPLQAMKNNFNRLDELILNNNAHSIIFTGDLFHSTVNSEWDAFCSWRKKYHSVDMHIIPGNHDRFDLDCYSALPLSVHKNSFKWNPFTFAHHPLEAPDGLTYHIAGHIHPVIRLSGKANQQFRFPCFYFGQQQAILPSFGYFTGGHEINPQTNDRVFAVIENKVVDASVFFKAAAKI